MSVELVVALRGVAESLAVQRTMMAAHQENLDASSQSIVDA